MESIKLTERHLDDLLRRCTPWPWGLMMKENGDWAMVVECANGYRSVVCDKLPEIGNNYDRRLWALAPTLAAEVLYLRKKLQEKDL